MTKFEPGDVVRLKNGKKPMVVCAVSPNKNHIRAIYSSGMGYARAEFRSREPTWAEMAQWAQSWRSADDYEVYTLGSTENENMPKLYEIKNEDGTTAFGTYLAQNSEGKLVLEIKGTGEVKAFAPADVSEVVPYTVQIRIMMNGAAVRQGNTSPHYRCVKGSLAKGDVVMFTDGTLGKVITDDTKKADAQTLKGARKLVTERIADVETVDGEED